jgi:hypothetical protein
LKGEFLLENITADMWNEADLSEWLEAAEEGFLESFRSLGPGASTEEQIAYAYFYGGRRMRDAPAYSLEEFLYDKTDRIEIVQYGIESRFWFAGKEIPDAEALLDGQRIPDKTTVEEILYSKQIPASEFVVQAYVRDALYRRETSMEGALLRVAPPVIARTLHLREWNVLASYIGEVFREIHTDYSIFTDKNAGPVRQNIAELHTAVVEYAASLRKDDMGAAYLPRHLFIMLSQIQTHAANQLEDLSDAEEPSELDLLAMDNAYQGMMDTYEDLRAAVDDSLAAFRKGNIFLVKTDDKRRGRLLQIGIGGTEVWRRVIVPETYTLEQIHTVIQTLFQWQDDLPYRFFLNRSLEEHTIDAPPLDPTITIEDLHVRRVAEVNYEYGDVWSVQVIMLSPEDSKQSVFCVAGEKSPPPETLNGPVRFRKDIDALELGTDAERKAAEERLGADFDPDLFDQDLCNRSLSPRN